MVAELGPGTQVNDGVLDSWDQACDNVMFILNAKAQVDSEWFVPDAESEIDNERFVPDAEGEIDDDEFVLS